MEKSKFIVRKAKPEDALSIEHIRYEGWVDFYLNEEYKVDIAWVDSFFMDRFDGEGLKVRQRKINFMANDPSYLCVVAEDKSNGKVAGFLVAQEDGNPTNLLQLYVGRVYRGGGVGSILMERLDNWVSTNETMVGVVTYNDKSIKFYESKGFIDTGDRMLFRGRIPEMKMIREEK